MSNTTPNAYVAFNITNLSQQNGGGLPDHEIYVVLSDTAYCWKIDETTGIATKNPTKGEVSFTKLSKIPSGTIRVEASEKIVSGRIYFSSSNSVVNGDGGTINGPNTSKADFYYDFVEFTLNHPANQLNIDTTQVDQFGIPITLQVTPEDPNFPQGSGIIATMDRETLISDYRSAMTGAHADFAECVFSTGKPAYRILNPSDLLSGSTAPTLLDCTVAPPGGSPGAWQATLTITGPEKGSKIPTNSSVKEGWRVSGPQIPAGVSVKSCPGSPSRETIIAESDSSAKSNPFTSSTRSLKLNFYAPSTIGLSTYFDDSINSFFNNYQATTLKAEQSFPPTLLKCTMAPSGGSPGAWQATLTVKSGTLSGLKTGWAVSGPQIPADTTIHSFPSANTISLQTTNSGTNNPFGTVSTPSEYFFGGGDIVYHGKVVEITGIDNIDGGTSTYTVLQFTDPSGVDTAKYNIYYPFFTTNSVDADQKTPFGKPVPPPPSWWIGQGLRSFEAPSTMVFSASGVFADNTEQFPSDNIRSTILGAFENDVVTALTRGYAAPKYWKYRTGTITPVSNGSKTAKIALKSGQSTKGLFVGMHLSSLRISTIPMTVTKITSNSSLEVSSPLPILAEPEDLLAFAQFYPPGGTWSAFANFFHNGVPGDEITIGGRAYAFPYDDNGGFSSDLTSEHPTSVAITLGPWKPKPAIFR